MDTTPNPTPSSPSDLFGEPQRTVIIRDGDRDLTFDGWLISSVEEEVQGTKPELTYTIEAHIHLTKGESLVTHVVRRSASGNVGRGNQSVGVHEPGDSKAAIEWLKQNNHGRLGRVSKAAWVKACEAWPKLADQAVEHIE